MTTHWFGLRRNIKRSRSVSRKNLIPHASELEDRRLLSLTPTLTALTGSSSSLIGGQTLTLTATVYAQGGVQAVPDGIVTFYNGSTSLGTATLSGLTNSSAAATFTTSSLALGNYTFFATYAGDGSQFQGSGSTAQTAGIINTVAGNGISGGTGDGGLATSATLSSPNGVAVDPAGDIFIADTSNNKIREVVKSTGDIMTVAGTGGSSYRGDGGPATAAWLFSPEGVAVDAAGNIFIADTNNSAIREVVKSTGNIMTVAGHGGGPGYGGNGGPATASLLFYPSGVAVDTIGNILIADSYNFEIREVVKSSGNIIAVGGNDSPGYGGDGGPAISAEFGLTRGVTLDSTGDIFVADQWNNAIREVDSTTGKISTVAGNGRLSYSGDGGLATGAELGRPSGVAVDSAGDIFILDTANLRIREVLKSTGDIITVAGNGTWSYGGYGGDGGPATSAQLGFPSGLTVDAAGDIFVADTYNNAIREINASGFSVSVVATVSIALNSSNHTNAVTFAVQGSSEAVTINGATTLYNPANTSSISIIDPPGRDTLTVNVESTLPTIAVAIQLGSGHDTVNICPTAQNLSLIQGNVTIMGGTGSGKLNVNDQIDSQNRTYNTQDSYFFDLNLEESSLTWSGSSASIVYSGGVSTLLNGGVGVNTLVGPSDTSLWKITGANKGVIANANLTFAAIQTLQGGGGGNDFAFQDGVTFAGNIIGGGGLNKLDLGKYTTTTSVNLQLSQATGLGGTFSSIQQFTGGKSPAGNTIIGANTNNIWAITRSNFGSLNGNITFNSFGNIVGGTANDVFSFAYTGSLSGSINGGGGIDWLDYSAIKTPINVNLATGAATLIAGGISNIQNLRGGSGGNTLTGNSQGNILIGGSGNDTIIGGSGRSILIGKSGTDTITGGSADDIVIGGTTSLDGNFAALDVILLEWQSATDNAATRIAKIRAGVSYGNNAVAAFSSSTVTTNGKSKLTGGAGNNWFWSGTNDTITDLNSGDQVN